MVRSKMEVQYFKVPYQLTSRPHHFVQLYPLFGRRKRPERRRVESAISFMINILDATDAPAAAAVHA